MTDLRKDSYNTYAHLPDISYLCVEYLLNNNDLIWRLLKYTDSDAWKSDSIHSNLSQSEKGALIYDGKKEQTSCRVFLSLGQDASWVDEVCILRVCPVEVIPSNYIWGNVVVGFQVFAHDGVDTLSNY